MATSILELLDPNSQPPFLIAESRRSSNTSRDGSLAVSLTHDHPAQAALVVSQLRLRERNHHLMLLSGVSAAINRSDTVAAMLDDCLRILVDHLPLALAGVCLFDEAREPTAFCVQARNQIACGDTIDFVARDVFCRELRSYMEPDIEVKYSSAIRSKELADWALRQDLPIFGQCALFCESRRLGVLFFFSNQFPTDAVRAAVLAVSDQLGNGVAQRQSNEALRFTQFTVDNLATAIFWIDEHGVIIKINAAACALTGYERGELLSAKAHQIAGCVRGKKWRRLWNRLCNRHSISIEGNIRQKDSTELPVEIKGNVVQFGGKCYFCAMVTDISDRKLAERKLRQSERALQTTLARMQLQVKCLTAAYIFLDADLRIVDWNPYAEHIFGFKKSEILGWRPFHPGLTTRASQGELESALTDARNNMHSWLTISNMSKNGQLLRCEWTVAPVCDDRGSVEGVLCLAQDVTQRTQLEEQCKRGQRLEALGRLAAGIAHDFNNFLTIIMGFADVIRDGLSERDSLRGAVQEIKTAGERAKKLISQLMTFSRNETPVPQSVNVNDAIVAMKPALEQLIGSNMKLQMELSNDVKPILIDSSQLEQILLNLIGNARDAMAGRGELCLRTSSMTWRKNGGPHDLNRDTCAWSVLTVTDSGCGMSEGVKERIFEPFFTTKEPGKGTGLGLAVVYAIVSQAGGYLDITSEVDQGTTVTIYFPSHAPANFVENAPARTSECDDGLSGAGKVVLIVETDESLKMMISTALSTRGFHVFESQSSLDAVEQAFQRSPSVDLIISRVHPAIGDYSQWLDQAPDQGRRTKTLFISGGLEQELHVSGLLPRGAAFLQKPFSTDTLLRRVRDVLGLSR